MNIQSKRMPFYALIFVLLSAALSLSAQLRISPFNHAHDAAPISALIKEEWHKLFPMPQFDQALINKIFFTKHPIDWAHPDKELSIIVFRIDGIFAGFMTYFFAQPGIAHIELFAIDKQFRSKGYGKTCIDYLINQALKKGAHELELYVYNTNPKAIEFYTHLGFETKTRYPSYLLLSKHINNSINEKKHEKK